MYKRLPAFLTAILLFLCLSALAETKTASDETQFLEVLSGYRAEGQSSFEVCCGESLFETLKKSDFEQLNVLNAEAGIESARDMSYYTDGRVCYQGVRWISCPFRTCSTQAEFEGFLAEMRAGNCTEFRVTAVGELKTDYPSADALWGLAERCGMADDGETVFYTNGRCDFTDVRWSEDLSMSCGNEQDILSAFREIGAQGLTSFRMILDYDLYAEVTKDDLKVLKRLEEEAGVAARRLSYSPSGVLVYSEAVIRASIEKADTIAEAKELVRAAAEAGRTELSLQCSKELYAELTGQTAFGTDRMSELLKNNGVLRYTWNSVDDVDRLDITNITYYAGMKILNAYRSGDTSVLTDKERETLTEALELARQASGVPDETERALFIHDQLCVRIRYTIDPGSEENDCAIGALLNGRADCDGYSDAFYLTASLAGLQVRYQHGDTYEKTAVTEATHMWDLILLDGSWYAVDVTWDDSDDLTGHLWFVIGDDRLSLTHIYEQELTATAASTTEADRCFCDEYIVSDRSSLNDALKEIGKKKHEVFTLVSNGSMSRETILEAIKALHFKGTMKYVWHERIGAVTVTEIHWD